MKSEKKTYKGLQEDVRKIELPKVDVWENKYNDKKYTVSFNTPEFTCICPKTGLPDFAEIRIEYSARKYCLELKSVKEYLMEYREIGIFHEHVINRILEDFSKVCKPYWMRVKGVFNTRGGITTTVTAEFQSS